MARLPGPSALVLVTVLVSIGPVLDAHAQNYTFTILAGTPGTLGSADGQGATARFNLPGAMVVDDAGTLFVADTWNHTIRKVTASGVVTTLAGLAGNPGSGDGVGSAARFNGPHGIAVDGSGDRVGSRHLQSHRPHDHADGRVTTVVGLAGVRGSVDGVGSGARFNHPWGVAVDVNGTVYVTDADNATIRTITYPGVTTTLAGRAGFFGSVDGLGASAGFEGPQAITSTDQHVLFVVDGLGTIRRVTPIGLVSTVARLGRSGTICIPGCRMNACGVGCSIFWLCYPASGSLGVDALGRILVPGGGGLTSGPPCEDVYVVSPLAGGWSALTGIPADVTVGSVAVDSSAKDLHLGRGHHQAWLRRRGRRRVARRVGTTGRLGVDDRCGRAGRFRRPRRRREDERRGVCRGYPPARFRHPRVCRGGDAGAVRHAIGAAQPGNDARTRVDAIPRSGRTRHDLAAAGRAAKPGDASPGHA